MPIALKKSQSTIATANCVRLACCRDLSDHDDLFWSEYGSIVDDKFLQQKFLAFLRELDNNWHEVLIRCCQKNLIDLIRYMRAKYTLDFSEGLVTACTFGFKETVVELLNSGARVHLNNDEALRIAVRRGHVEIAHLLISYGASVNANNNEPLFIARQNNNEEIIELLIKHGAKDRALVKNDKTFGKYISLLASPDIEFNKRCIFEDECVNKNYKFIKKILKDKWLDINDDNNYSLKNAIGRKDLKLVKLLVSYGADVGKHFCLDEACRLGFLSIAKYLVMHGAYQTSSSLDEACQSGNKRLVGFLLREFKTHQVNLNIAIERVIQYKSPHKYSIIKYLIQEGGNVNGTTGSALKYALEQRDFKLAKFLIKKGSEGLEGILSPLKNILYYNPLVPALISQDFKMINFLIKNNLKVSDLSKEDIEKICLSGNKRIINLLIRSGVKRNFILASCANLGYFGIAKKLLKNCPSFYEYIDRIFNYSATYNSTAGLEFLVNNKFDFSVYITTNGFKGINPISDLISKHAFAAASYLIKTFKLPSSCIDEKFRFKLCWQEDIEAIRFCYENLFDISKEGYRDLHFSVLRHRWVSAQFLINLGVNIFFDNNKIFRCACYYENLPALDYLTANWYDLERWGKGLLSYSMRYLKYKSAVYLIKRGISAVQTLGALINNGKYEEVSGLLKNGLDPHYGDNLIMRWAIYFEDARAIKLLIDNGYNLKIKDGETICYSLNWGNSACTDLLLSLGADINQALIFAVDLNYSRSAINKIILLGADVSNLHSDLVRVCCQKGNLDALQTLLNIDDNIPVEAIYDACSGEEENNDIVNLLLEKSHYTDILNENILNLSFSMKHYDNFVSLQKHFNIKKSG